MIGPRANSSSCHRWLPNVWVQPWSLSPDSEIQQLASHLHLDLLRRLELDRVKPELLASTHSFPAPASLFPIWVNGSTVHLTAQAPNLGGVAVSSLSSLQSPRALRLESRRPHPQDPTAPTLTVSTVSAASSSIITTSQLDCSSSLLLPCECLEWILYTVARGPFKKANCITFLLRLTPSPGFLLHLAIPTTASCVFLELTKLVRPSGFYICSSLPWDPLPSDLCFPAPWGNLCVSSNIPSLGSHLWPPRVTLSISFYCNNLSSSAHVKMISFFYFFMVIVSSSTRT